MSTMDIDRSLKSLRNERPCDVCTNLILLVTNESVNIDLSAIRFFNKHHYYSKWNPLTNKYDYDPAGGSPRHLRLRRRHYFEEEAQKAERDPCSVHQALFSWLQQSFEQELCTLAQKGIDDIRSKGYDYCLERQPGKTPKILLTDYKRRRCFEREVLLQAPPIMEQSPTQTELPISHLKPKLDAQYINLNVAEQWVDTCVRRGTCKDMFNMPYYSPPFLIDTINNSLVANEDGAVAEFVALSYRWSSKYQFQTDNVSLQKLQQEGGILNFAQDGKVAPTISHAMQVVQSMGKRYLWVDAICLVKDTEDDNKMRHQLLRMGSIYASAVFTIIAIDGDASDGLLGLKGVSGPRNLQNIFTLMDGREFSVRDLPILSESDGPCSEYFQRGWTYQEYFLSRRRLIFGKKQIHWNCSCGTRHEDLPNEAGEDSRNSAPSSLQTPNIFCGQPDFQELQSLLREYHNREFTYVGDALPGARGLLEVLGRSFKGGFLCGLPEVCFDAALMWHCGLGGGVPSQYSKTTVLKRRMFEESTRSPLPGSVLPSWSWIGWKSNWLVILTDEREYKLDKKLVNELYKRELVTTTITKWYSQSTLEGHEKRLINSTWHEIPNNPLFHAQGWTKQDYDEVKHFQDNTHGMGTRHEGDRGSEISCKYVYQHPSWPSTDYFWRPIPVPALDHHEQPIDIPQHQFISCETQRGKFFARQKVEQLEHTFWTNMDMNIVLLDRSMVLCGWLQVPNEAKEEFPPSVVGDLGASDKEIEVVAICKRKIDNICNSSDNEGMRWPEFYGVLWVEWNGRVAYRRGCGYIKTDIWDQYNTEDIHLVLG